MQKYTLNKNTSNKWAHKGKYTESTYEAAHSIHVAMHVGERERANVYQMHTFSSEKYVQKCSCGFDCKASCKGSEAKQIEDCNSETMSEIKLDKLTHIPLELYFFLKHVLFLPVWASVSHKDPQAKTACCFVALYWQIIPLLMLLASNLPSLLSGTYRSRGIPLAFLYGSW